MKSDSRIDCSESFPQKYEDLSFDEWKDLHEADPERFEKYRKKLINGLVDAAPGRLKARLRGLIFQMEAEAKRSKSLMAYNMRLSTMMMEMMEELRYQSNMFVGKASRGDTKDQSPVKTATVLPFKLTSRSLSD